MVISLEARSVIGLLLVSMVTIEYGGAFLLGQLRRGRGTSLSEPQRSFFRAGHAHAGVLVILAIVAQLLVDVVGWQGAAGWAVRAGFFTAPILVSAGFFGGAPNAEGRPGRLLVLVYVGAALLALSLLALGLGLLLG